jgi:phage I-like protein
VRTTLSSLIELADDGADSGVWNLLAYSGTFRGHVGGEFRLDADAFVQMVANFNRGGIDLPMTYGHPRSSTEAAMTGASGWITALEVRESEGRVELWGRVAWTKRAKTMIASDELRYVSIVFDSAGTDPVTGDDIGWVLYEAGAVLAPFLTQQPKIAADQSAGRDQMSDERKALGAGLDALGAALAEAGLEVEDVEAWLLDNAEAIAKMIAAPAEDEGESESGDGEAMAAGLREALSVARDRITALEREVDGARGREIEGMVDAAISRGALPEDRRDRMIALGRSSREALTEVLELVGDARPPTDSQYRPASPDQSTKLSRAQQAQLRVFMSSGYDRGQALAKVRELAGEEKI